jgi:hypothetical protein
MRNIDAVALRRLEYGLAWRGVNLRAVEFECDHLATLIHVPTSNISPPRRQERQDQKQDCSEKLHTTKTSETGLALHSFVFLTFPRKAISFLPGRSSRLGG